MGKDSEAVKLTWAEKFWPIKRHELKKIIPLLLLKFLASIIYTLLICLKDTFVVTADCSGAEVIPVLKGWVVFPLSVLCVIAYTKLSNHFKRSTLFYSFISIFLVLIAVHSFFLYPNFDSLAPYKSSDWLLQHFGSKYTHWISVYRNWIHSIFFIIAELWGQVVIFILFWGFVNHICRMQEAKRTYTLLIAAGDLAAIIAAPISWYYAQKNIGQDFAITLQTLTLYILACGVLILGIYWWANRYILSNPLYFNPSETKAHLNEKTKLSLRKSIKHIFSSKYLLSIAVLVIGCALTINMVEVTYKANLELLCPTKEAYQAFTSKLTFILGIVALFTVLILGGNVQRIFGWHFSAQITPITVGITGALFFILCLFRNHLEPYCSLIGISSLSLIVFFGAFQNLASKVVKYSFFDSTKEMTYIPLDQESKVKGKAAIDMVGSRLGKSSSSWIQLILMQIAGTGSIFSTTPYLLPILLLAVFYWSYSVKYLNKELQSKEGAEPTSKTPEKELISEIVKA